MGAQQRNEMGSAGYGILTRPCQVDKLEKEGAMKQTKKPFDRCPACGGEIVRKEVEKLLRGGVNTAVVKVYAAVCLHCGERLYSQETVIRVERIREKLERRAVADFELVGQSFQVAVSC